MIIQINFYHVLYSTKNKPAQGTTYQQVEKDLLVINNVDLEVLLEKESINGKVHHNDNSYLKSCQHGHVFHNMMDVDQMNTLKPQPPNAKKPSRLQSKREKNW